MKKVLLLSLVAILSIGVAVACTNTYGDQPVAISELPAKITNFVKEHFAGIDISYAKKDKGIMSEEFEVVLNNGAKIEFDKNNEWEEVDCERGTVPATIVPKAIGDYITQYYPQARVEKISRGRGYEVELSNDLELSFDKAGKFLRMDD